MRKVIIGIHGLGNKPPKDILENWWKLSIDEGLKKNNLPSIEYEFELVYWADILHSKLLNVNETDPKSDTYISEKYFPSEANVESNNNGIKHKTFGYLEKKYDKLITSTIATLKYPSLTELYIHNYLPDLESYYSGTPVSYKGEELSAKEFITSRLIDILDKYKNKEILLVSHSMGTIISHDVLTEALTDVNINTLVTMGSPLGQKYIVNKMQEVPGINDFDKLQVPEKVKNNWFNLSDPEDEFAFVNELGGIYGPNSKGLMVNDKLVDNDYAANGIRNHHKVFGYLRTNEFSQILMQFYTEEKPKIYAWFKSKLEKLFGEN